MTVLSYRAHPAITKAAFVAEMKAHAAADRIVSGHYWIGGTGCAVGCGVQSIMTLNGPYIAGYGDHAAHAAALGIPVWLSLVQDALFEGLRPPGQQAFPVKFALALPDGADLSGLYAAWMPWVLREIALPAAGRVSGACAVIERVAAGIETDWVTDDQDAARTAADAASLIYGGVDSWYAIRAAAFAAGAVAGGAVRDAASSGARANIATTDAAAAAAQIGATSRGIIATRNAAYVRMANKLLTLMAACPVVAVVPAH